MKTNKILLLILLGFSLSSFSQKTDPLSKGNYFIETNFRGGFIGGGENHWLLNLRPTAGKFIEDSWAIGVTSMIELYKFKSSSFSDGTTLKANQIRTEIGLFTQYYVVGGLYAKFSATAGMMGGRYTGHDNWSKFSYTLSPEIGYDFFLGKKKRIALGASFTYDISNIDSGYGEVEYPIPFMYNNSNFRFNLSIKFIIGKKK